MSDIEKRDLIISCLHLWSLEHKLADDHGFKHYKDVATHAMKAISYCEFDNSNQAFAVFLAALLHDVDDRKLKITPLKNYQGEKFPWAAFFLDVALITEDVKKLVFEMIDLVSTSKNGNLPIKDQCMKEWMLIPRYADRITATGDIGAQRCAEVAKKIGNPRATMDTPLVTDEKELEVVMKGRTLDDYIKSGGKSKSQIDHYYDKLLQLHLDIHIQCPYIHEQMKVGYVILKEHLFKLCVEEKKAREMVTKDNF